ncbi:AAA family ATPase [Sorangium sp. So ce1335]|uniref:AAA family ATPase n=1 Tax=Sorangium sp. So ce1335 TaxID=3133335 RepID=UPI003F62AC81
MALRVPLGIDDFRKLRESGLEYVDKTHLIRELIDKEGVEVVLLPRPRRFGKTLNLSMLRWFFEKRQEDLSGLFEGLSVWEPESAIARTSSGIPSST